MCLADEHRGDSNVGRVLYEWQHKKQGGVVSREGTRDLCLQGFDYAYFSLTSLSYTLGLGSTVRVDSIPHVSVGAAWI